MSLPTAPREIDLYTERSRPSCSISRRVGRIADGSNARPWSGVEIIASGRGTFDGCARLLTPGGVHTGEATRRRQGRFYILYQSSRVKLMSGLVARRHVDLLRVIAMACPFLG